jgi:hypothetical protein
MELLHAEQKWTTILGLDTFTDETNTQPIFRCRITTELLENDFCMNQVWVFGQLVVAIQRHKDTADSLGVVLTDNNGTPYAYETSKNLSDYILADDLLEDSILIPYGHEMYPDYYGQIKPDSQSILDINSIAF